MSRPVTDLEDALPFDKRKRAHDPVLPAVERNRRRDEIVGERELMIEQAEEQTQKCFHEQSNLVGKKIRV